MRKTLKVFACLFLAVVALVAAFGALNYRADVPVAELKARYANAESEFMDLDGMAVHYRDEGNPADETPMVLLHGTSASLLTWDGWTESLKAGQRVIRLDLPGYALTGPNPANDYAMSYYTRFLHEFLQRLGIERLYLAGNSLGGRIAWEYALAYPGEVEKLILVDAAGYPLSGRRPLVFQLATIPVLKDALRVVTPKFLVESSLKEVYADDSKVTGELVDQYYDMTCREGNRAAFAARAGVVYEDNHLKLNQIRAPTLILWGEQDAWIPVENAYRFQNDLPDSTLVVFPNLGHIPHEESPAETVEAVLKFISASPGPTD